MKHEIRDYHIIEKEFDDKYEANIRKERQLPDYRDGMRMVQRRLYWVFLSMSKDRRYNLTKSASIVGDTIKLHPHGDCLHPSTLFYHLDGSIKTIKEMYDFDGDEFYILSFDKNARKYKYNKATNIRIGQRSFKNYRFRMSDGGVFECTPNHPFLVYDKNGDYIWKKAEELLVNDMFVSGVIENINQYPKLRTREGDFEIHKLVCPSESDEVTHHIDHDTKNNLPNNLKVLSRSEHAKLHGDYLIGLQKGVESMKNDPDLRDAIKRKNAKICQIYNQNFGLNKAFYILKRLKEKNIEISCENYATERRGVYNGPHIKSLISIGYISDFDDLVNQFNSFGGLNTEEAKGFTKYRYEKKAPPHKEAGMMRKNQLLRNFSMLQTRSILKYSSVLNDINYEKQRKLLNQGTSISERNSPTLNTIIKNFNSCEIATKNMFTNICNFVENITVVEYPDGIDMFDFTVAGDENALIVNTRSSNEYTFLISHNSSIYDSLVNEVNSDANLIRGKGNWGCKSSSIPSKPAKMRYTECALRKEADEYFHYAHLSDMIMGENNELEPVYIPVPFPLALLGGFFGISKAGQVNVPTYKISDLNKRLKWLIGDRSGKPPIIKPYYGSDFQMEGDFEDLLIKGSGKVIVKPILNVDEKAERITLRSFCPTITNAGGILEKISVHPKFGRYIEITDLSAKKNEIIIEYKTKYMKNVDITFDQLIKLVEKEFTCTNNYRIITYRDFNDYPDTSVDSWILNNFKQIISFRFKELNKMIEGLNQKLRINEAILIIRPIIQTALNKYQKFDADIIERIKTAALKLLNDTELVAKVFQISLNRLLDCDIDIESVRSEIKSLNDINNETEHQKFILNWIENLSNRS